MNVKNCAKYGSFIGLILMAGYCTGAQQDTTKKPGQYVVGSKPAVSAPQPVTVEKPKAPAPVAKPAAAAVKSAGSADTLTIVARITEIPGRFAPNDLYNYVYVMKYRVLKVEKGSYSGQDILVGQYNPLIPRKNIKDKMAPLARGTADKFEVGLVHRLVLVTPIEKVWKDAVEDEYMDSELEKHYAVQTDLAK